MNKVVDISMLYNLLLSVLCRQMLAYGRRVPLEEFEYRIDVRLILLIVEIQYKNDIEI